MDNRIEQLMVTDMRLDPAEAEVWITVLPKILTSTTQVRGRLMGPRCPFATTVEVAYPLREHSRTYESEGTPKITLRVIIPEANFWEPATPFLYEGPLELWQSSQRCEVVEIRHGIRSLQFGRRGLRLNGRQLYIRGVRREALAEADALSLHQAGVNAILIRVGPNAGRCCEIGDRYGLLMLGQITCRADLEYCSALNGHPSLLGWVVSSDFFQDLLFRDVGAAMLAGNHTLGMECRLAPTEIPSEVSFLVCDETPERAGGDKPLPPVIIRDKGKATEPGTAPPPGILGWIEDQS